MRVIVRFRDEYGRVSLGELVNSFRIFVEGLREIVEIDHLADEIDVATFDGETIMVHRVPLLAVVDMKEVVRT